MKPGFTIKQAAGACVVGKTSILYIIDQAKKQMRARMV